jgi:hypothetical protein
MNDRWQEANTAAKPVAELVRVLAVTRGRNQTSHEVCYHPCQSESSVVPERPPRMTRMGTDGQVGSLLLSGKLS